MLVVKYMNDLKEWAREEIQLSASHKTRFLVGGSDSLPCEHRLLGTIGTLARVQSSSRYDGNCRTVALPSVHGAIRGNRRVGRAQRGVRGAM